MEQRSCRCKDRLPRTLAAWAPGPLPLGRLGLSPSHAALLFARLSAALAPGTLRRLFYGNGSYRFFYSHLLFSQERSQGPALRTKRPRRRRRPGDGPGVDRVRHHGRSPGAGLRPGSVHAPLQLPKTVRGLGGTAAWIPARRELVATNSTPTVGGSYITVNVTRTSARRPGSLARARAIARAMLVSAPRGPNPGPPPG
jgi:hypothetical protein